jgi:hypothetical protein
VYKCRTDRAYPPFVRASATGRLPAAADDLTRSEVLVRVNEIVDRHDSLPAAAYVAHLRDMSPDYPDKSRKQA